ncbi:hypothetical protein M422DRAFT_34467 [Sphaerobolus stellatus SS14]|uniref:Uncharacterized protein n=1 Tax=Sphaerobolus stellatus (strain SS14) TaxID=990650 RepID=A0A0C9TZY9_SPHS4|nr:hypothetical protein M422DRAFT_34467 [Sphaerobolus stellatus SS14]
MTTVHRVRPSTGSMCVITLKRYSSSLMLSVLGRYSESYLCAARKSSRWPFITIGVCFSILCVAFETTTNEDAHMLGLEVNGELDGFGTWMFGLGLGALSRKRGPKRRGTPLHRALRHCSS